jgi:hypothetical protein
LYRGLLYKLAVKGLGSGVCYFALISLIGCVSEYLEKQSLLECSFVNQRLA